MVVIIFWHIPCTVLIFFALELIWVVFLVTVHTLVRVRLLRKTVGVMNWKRGLICLQGSTQTFVRNFCLRRKK